MKNLFKIGVRGHDVGELTTQEIIDYCHENGIDGLQLVINKTWPDLYEARDEETIVANILKLKENRIEIFLLGCYFNPIHPNEKSLAADIDRVNFVCKIAKLTNCAYIGSETGSINGDDWTYNELNHTKESFDGVVNTFTRFKNDLVNVEFLVEPVYDHVIYDIEQLEKLHKELGQGFLTTLDLSNLLNCDNALEYLEIFEKAIKSQKDNIRLFHFKNFTIENNMKQGCGLDKGIIDYSKIIQIIKENNLLHVPIIVEELSGLELIDSIKYLKEMEK